MTMKNKQKRTVFAPHPILVVNSSLPANRVICVKLDADEDVEWIWTLLPNKTKYVSGYTIIKK